MIYADFESILVPEDNGKQNPNESYTNKYQKHVACSKEFVVTKEDNENFENSTRCLICDNYYVDGDAKIRDHCHMNGKCKGSAQRDCNISVKLSHKIPVAS